MKRKTNDQPLKEVLQEFLQDSKYKAKFTQTHILAHWEDLMGKPIASQTRKLEISKTGTLKITVDSAVLRHELNYGKEKIKKIINEALKEDFVKEVQIF